MQKDRFVSVCCALTFGAALSAQEWSVFAATPSPAQAIVRPSFSAPGTTNTLPIAAVAPGTFLSATGFGAHTSATWNPLPASTNAPVGFELQATGGGPAGTYSSVEVDLDIVLVMPQLVGGRLRLEPSYTTTGVCASASIFFDVGADGAFEHLATRTNREATEIFIPAGVSVIRTRMIAGHYSLTGQCSAEAAMSVTARFYPGQPAVREFDATGAGTDLLVEHTPLDEVTIAMEANANQTPLLLAIGFEPLVNPVLPGVTQLVSLDAILAVPSLTLELPPLPPGTELFCQGLVIQAGTLRSSNSVRAIWP